MYTGINTPEGKYAVMNGEQYEKYRIEAFRTIGQVPPWAPIEEESIQQGRTTNWQDMLLQNGFQQQHDINLIGGTENTKYAVSGGFFNEKGVISLQDFTRYNLKVSVNQNVGKRLKLGFSSFAALSTRNGENLNPLSEALGISPLTVPYDKDGNLIFFPNPSETVMKNPLADFVPGALKDETKQSRIFASLFAEYNITHDLSFRVNFGPNFSTSRHGAFSASQTTIRAEAAAAARRPDLGDRAD